MTKKAEEAIRDSIEHWKRMRKNPSEDEIPTSAYCALCSLRYSATCNGCPVSAKTGESHCRETPFSNASFAFWDAIEAKAPEELKEWRKAATLEIKFLESLLPKQQKGKQ